MRTRELPTGKLKQGGTTYETYHPPLEDGTMREHRKLGLDSK
jgi:hypothetical protein